MLGQHLVEGLFLWRTTTVRGGLCMSVGDMPTRYARCRPTAPHSSGACPSEAIAVVNGTHVSQTTHRSRDHRQTPARVGTGRDAGGARQSWHACAKDRMISRRFSRESGHRRLWAPQRIFTPVSAEDVGLTAGGDGVSRSAGFGQVVPPGPRI